MHCMSKLMLHQLLHKVGRKFGFSIIYRSVWLFRSQGIKGQDQNVQY